MRSMLERMNGEKLNKKNMQRRGREGKKENR